MPMPGESDTTLPGTMPGTAMDAMQRLADRQNASGEAGNSRTEGFEQSVHKIKEQVLPRLLERVDPEAAATLGKDELAEEFRPIIGEVLVELKLTLNRREQFALERYSSTSCWAWDRWRNCSPIRPSPTSWSTVPSRPMSSARASSSSRRSSSATRSICSRSRSVS